MIRMLALLLGLLVAVGAVILCGLLTNWFRYGLSLEGTFVLAAALVAVVTVGWVSYMTYTRNSAGLLGVNALAALVAIAIVLFVHQSAFGRLPGLYMSHSERSPPALFQTQSGSFRYWIEIENPFSSEHAEFLVIDGEAERRIPIQAFAGPAKGYASAAKPNDWGVLSQTSDPGVAILTLGPFLSPAPRRFQIDLNAGTATKLP